jgi:putative flippase GtrA
MVTPIRKRRESLYLRMISALQGKDATFLRFLIVGATNFLISYSVFRWLFMIPVNIAAKSSICQLASYGAGIAWSFFLNRRFTFHGRERVITQARRFAFIQIILALTSAGLIGLMIDYLKFKPSVSWLLIMGVFTIINYVICRVWVFR